MSDSFTLLLNIIVYKLNYHFFGVLLTVGLSIFISVFNQLDAQNLFHNKYYFMPLHVSSTCAHNQEVKIDDTRGCVETNFVHQVG